MIFASTKDNMLYQYFNTVWPLFLKYFPESQNKEKKTV